jgi:hypothetical protein
MERSMTSSDVREVAEGFQASTQRGFARLKDERARNVYGIAIAALDHSRLEGAQRDFEMLSGDPANKGVPKIEDLPRQLELASAVAVSWQLSDSAPLKILGLGRSVTHLLYCAKSLGHDVTVATAHNPVHDRLMALYGLDHFAQKRGSDVPNGKFDVIVSGNLFHASDDRWAAFFRPLMPVLEDDGRLMVTVLRRPMPDRGFDPARTLAMFEQLGAEVSRRDFSARLTRQQMASLIKSIPRQPRLTAVAAEAAPSIVPDAAGALNTPPAASAVRPVANKPSGATIVAIVTGAAVVLIAAAWWFWTHR